MNRTNRFALSLTALLAVLLFAAACAINPATGERQFSLVSESQEIQMGREADGQIVASLGLYPDSTVQRYVRDLGLRLAAVSERPELPWTFRVVDDPVVNAFALPGGFVYITRGILAHLTSEAELVGILGHEIGHVTARHSVSQMSRQQLAQIGLVAGMVFSERVRALGDVASQSLQLLFLKYGRDDESEADELGFRYMTRENYDPRELSGVFRMLARVSASSGQRIPEWLSTHPDPGNRADRILRMADESGQDFSGATVNAAPYVRGLDGFVFGPNPREGYFEDGEFYHPDLRFALTFPQGWSAQNSKASVQAVSAEQDAILGLTIAEGNTAAAAQQAFLAQEGLEVVTRWSQRVNGLPAAGGEFRAATQDGTMLHGVFNFVEYGGAVYQLLGYGLDGIWGARSPAAQAFIYSFRPVTDARILNVQPDRLRVVALPRAMTFQQFLQNYPSSVPQLTLELINQVDEQASFAQGGLVKRIVGG